MQIVLSFLSDQPHYLRSQTYSGYKKKRTFFHLFQLERELQKVYIHFNIPILKRFQRLKTEQEERGTQVFLEIFVSLNISRA